MTHRLQAIVLLYTPSGEHDRLYALYTIEMGKISLLVKGARKIESKLAAHLEPPVFADVLLARGKQRDHLAGALVIKDFHALKSQGKRRYLALEAARLVDLLVPMEASEPAVFQLLINFLNYLEREKIASNALALFTDKLLSLTGHGAGRAKKDAMSARVSEVLGREYRPYLA